MDEIEIIETHLAPKADINMTHRVGTLFGTKEDLIKVLGEPHEDASTAEKITAQWTLMTPAGVATIYDYWWNRPNEWSIGGHTDEVCDHVANFLVRNGIDNPKVLTE